MSKMNYYDLLARKDFENIADNIDILIENLRNSNADFDSYYDQTRRFFDKAFTHEPF